MKQLLYVYIVLLTATICDAQCIESRESLKKFAEKMLEVNKRDLKRELQFRKNTWINENKGHDPNLTMHKSIETRLP